MAIWLVDCLLTCLGVLPEPLVRILGEFLGFFAYRILRFRVSIVRSQLEQAFPEFDLSRRLEIERGFYRHFGLLVMEILCLPHTKKNQVLERTRIVGKENVDKAAATAGVGVFILTAHMGNWEMAMAAFGARGIPTHSVVKEARGKVGQHLMDAVRGKHHVFSVSRHKSIREIFHLIKSEKSVGFVLDQNMTADEGVFVDFFGRQACTMPGLAVMARRLNAPVIPMSCYRDENYRHCIELHPPVPWEEPEGAAPEEVVKHNTQRYTKILEDMIRKHPEQWLWIHKRWRTQPRRKKD